MVHVPSKTNGKRNGNALAKAEAEAQAANEAPQVDVSASSTVIGTIKTLIGRADKQISAYAHAIILKANEVAAAPLMMSHILQQQYCQPDKDGNPTLPLSDFFPRPAKDAKIEAELLAGNNSAHREFFEAAKLDKAGELKTRKCNFFTESWNETTEGKTQDFILKQCSHVLDKGGDASKAEEKYRQMPLDKVSNLREKTTRDKAKGRKLIRQGVGLWYVQADFIGLEERVILESDGDDIETLTASQYPMNLVDIKRKRVYRPMSIGDILKLDVHKAVVDAGVNGSLYDKLIDQLKRGANDGEMESELFKTPDEVFAFIRRFNNFYDVGTKEGKDNFDYLKNAFTRKGSNPLVQEWGDFVGNVKASWNSALQARYEKIQDKAIETTDEEKTA